MKQKTLCRILVVLLALFVWLQYKLATHFHRSENRFATSSSTADSATTRRVDTATPLINEEVCSKFSKGQTTAATWQAWKSRIVQALQHPRDTQKLHADWTRQLLDLLTPHELENSIKGRPSFQSLLPVFHKLAKRLADPETNLPVKILVFGGSIVEGTGCGRSPIPGGKLDFETLQECAWPFRLQMALDKMFGHMLGVNGSLIDIYNLAAGGTHSEAAIPVLDYWLSPVFDPSGADIIINAYSANDNLPPAFHATMNTTIDNFHWARILKRNLDFVRAARDSNGGGGNHCSSSPADPVILYVNDYSGNQQESIIGEGQLDEAIQWMADHEASMGYVSVAHAVRRWVLADTAEDFFSAPWVDRKGRPAINVHYGMAGHVVTTVAIIFYLLQLMLEYCDSTAIFGAILPSQTASHLGDYLQIDLPSKEWVQQSQPLTIRPNITEWPWYPGPTKHHSKPCTAATFNSTASSAPCVFAFLAAPLGTHQNQGGLAEFLEPFTLQHDGWQVQNDFRHGGFQNKLGLVATKGHAKMIMGFSHQPQQPIRVITIHYLKSYGEHWEGSLVHFRAVALDAKGQKVHEESFALEGHHEQPVSVSYFFRLELREEVPIGGSLRFHLELVGGQAFKINALMFCSR